MEIVLTAILASVILNTATGGRSIGHNAAITVGSTVALCSACSPAPLRMRMLHAERQPAAKHFHLCPESLSGSAEPRRPMAVA
jgi:hypothetical protein